LELILHFSVYQEIEELLKICFQRHSFQIAGIQHLNFMLLYVASMNIKTWHPTLARRANMGVLGEDIHEVISNPSSSSFPSCTGVLHRPSGDVPRGNHGGFHM
jgi:hypothetical protein